MCVAGEKGSADTERDAHGFALKFYTEEGNWDLAGITSPVFFVRDAILVRVWYLIGLMALTWLLNYITSTSFCI